MQTKTFNRNDWSGHDITVRFNMPTADGQMGRLVIGDESFDLVSRDSDEIEVVQNGCSVFRISRDADFWFASNEDLCADLDLWGRDPIRVITIAGCNVGLW